MKKNFKRTLSLILAVLMVMTAVPLSGMATDATTCDHAGATITAIDGVEHLVRCSCGYRDYENCAGPEATTCGEAPKCTKCHAVIGEALAHDFTATVAEERYVATAGNCQSKTVYYKSCSVCGTLPETLTNAATFEGDFGAHVFTDYTAKGDATCTDPGHKEATCDVCGVAKDEIDGTDADKLAHNYIDAVVEANKISDATCTVGGIYYKSCEHCGAKSTETFTTDTIPHTFGETEVAFALEKSAATCTKKAVYYKNCSVCRTTAKNIDETATFEYGETHAKPTTEDGVAKPTAAEEASCLRKNATCEDDAIYSLVCKTCREPMIADDADMGSTTLKIKEGLHYYVKADTALNPGHTNLKKDMEKTSDAVEATCTAEGKTEIYKCTVDGCNGTFGGVTIPAKGHKYDEKKTVKYAAATCSKDGNYAYEYCTECKGDFYFDANGKSMTYAETLLKPLNKFGHTDSDADHICDRCNAEVTAKDTCTCVCHSGGVMYFIALILKFIWRISGTKPMCACGDAHY